MANSILRILGKSVAIRITQDGTLLDEITAIKNLTFTSSIKTLSEGYLGETAERQDEIFERIEGSFVVNPETTQILVLQKAITDRATRRVSGDTKINLNFRISFPNSQIARITIPDLQFDPIPLNVSARDAYPEMTFTFKAETYLLSV